VVAISKATGKPYFTSRESSIPCTFDEVLANAFIGQPLPGEIERIEFDEYEFLEPCIRSNRTELWNI
jgi:hypothetical protein